MDVLTKARLLCYPSLYRQVSLSGEEQIEAILNESSEVRENLSRNPDLTYEAAVQLLEGDSPKVRKALAEYTSHTEIHEKLSDDTRIVLSKLARNPHTTETIRQLLWETVSLRGILARHPHLTSDEIGTIRQHPELYAALAESPSLPAEFQEELYRTGNRLVHLGLLRNEQLSARLQRTFADSQDVPLLEVLATNPNLTEEMFAHLAESSVKRDNHDVLEGLGGNLNVPNEVQWALLEGGDYMALKGLAKNPNVDPGILTRIVGNTFHEYELAANPRLLPEDQERLYQANQSRLEDVLAANPSVSEDLRKVFAAGYIRTQEILAKNSSFCPWTELPPLFVERHHPDAFALLTQDLTCEDLEGIGASWNGSLASLHEAIELTRR